MSSELARSTKRIHRDHVFSSFVNKHVVKELVDFSKFADFYEAQEEIPFEEIAKEMDFSREDCRSKFNSFCREIGVERIGKNKEDLKVIDTLLRLGYRRINDVDWHKTKSSKSVRNFNSNEDVVKRYLKMVDPFEVKSFREQLELAKEALLKIKPVEWVDEKKRKKEKVAEKDIEGDYKDWIRGQK